MVNSGLWNLADNKDLKTISFYTFADPYASFSSPFHLWSLSDIDHKSPISKLTTQDINEIESKIKSYKLAEYKVGITDNLEEIISSIHEPTAIPAEESMKSSLKFTIALIRLRQEFDIDIEDSSNDIPSSEYDIEIE